MALTSVRSLMDNDLVRITSESSSCEFQSREGFCEAHSESKVRLAFHFQALMRDILRHTSPVPIKGIFDKKHGSASESAPSDERILRAKQLVGLSSRDSVFGRLCSP